MIELSLVGVRVELPTNQPIVLLKEADGHRYLPIWVGAVEATAIAFALQGIQTPRPMTHDLLRDILEETDVTVERVLINELVDQTFFALIRLNTAGNSKRCPPARATRSPLRCASTCRSSPTKTFWSRPGSSCEMKKSPRSRSSASSSTR